MRGSKTDDKLKEKALAMLATNMSMTKVAEELKIPLTTLSTWKKEAEKDQEFVELRKKNKEQFVKEAWGAITDSVLLLSRRIKRALENEEELDELKEELIANADTPEQKKQIVNKFSALKFEDVSKLSSVIGVLYDKQALCVGEETQKVGLTFEDYIKKCEAKNEY